MKKLLLILLIPLSFACSKTDCVDFTCAGGTINGEDVICGEGVWEEYKSLCDNGQIIEGYECICNQFK